MYRKNKKELSSSYVGTFVLSLHMLHTLGIAFCWHLSVFVGSTEWKVLYQNESNLHLCILKAIKYQRLRVLGRG